MGIEAIIVLVVVLVAVVLFATEWVAIDLVSMLIMLSLVVFGIISPQEGLAGFSNPATITVAFMFVISYSLLKTGALQRIGPLLSKVFRKNYNVGILTMILFIGVFSAFVNNTPIVAMFIPVMVSVANMSNISPSKLLIPLVSGIAESNGLEGFSMFYSAPIGLVFLIVGATYIFLFGKKLLPDRRKDMNLSEQYEIRNYITEIEILEGSDFVGQRIMDSIIAKEMELDIIEIRREKSVFALPTGDFLINKGDILKVRCNVDKIKELKDRLKVSLSSSAVKIGDSEIQLGNTTILELVITTGSEFAGKSLREMDFRRMFRAVPLAILHREEVLHENLHEVELRPGDVVLIEIKTHRVEILKKMEMSQNSPFIILSEQGIIDFDRRRFITVLSVIAAVVGLAAFNILPIAISAALGACMLVVSGTISMRELYKSIEWRIVFLLAGALSLGVAMNNSGLAVLISDSLIDNLGIWGPVAILSGLYITTSLLTEIMSNNATAALIAPIAIATAAKLEVSPYPFLIAVMLAASASFMTPIGYQTNTMVYSAGQYKFGDFFRIGVWLNLIFWIIATFLIPIIYPF
jgi:di/tricarboxylate transporter